MFTSTLVAKNPQKRIGDLRGGFLTWVTMGGAQLEIAGSPNPLAGRALKAAYPRSAGRYVLISHTLANLDLAGISKMKFHVASTYNSKFMVYLEERSPGMLLGPRYSALLMVPGGNKPVHESMALSKFSFDSSGPADPNGRLDPGQLKSISLIDIASAETPGSAFNTVWIGAIEPQ
jgi:hypothetical protein